MVSKKKETTATRERSPSFVCEIPLKVSPADERVLLAHLEAARQVYNACLGEAKRRVALVQESKLFQRARSLPKDGPDRKKLFAQAREHYAFREYDLHSYAGRLGQSWIGDHLDSLTVQKLASRAYQAANRLLLGQAKRVRFKGRNQMDSVEGKTNTSGIRWRSDHVEWSGLVLPGLIDARDPVLTHGLAARTKYVRLVRRKVGERNRFYAQLICEGVPFRKPQHALGQGRVGLDLGPSTIAVVSAQQATLQAFCPEVVPDARELRRLDRHIDRQRRANNPDRYDERGRIKPGKKHWHVSRRQRQTQAKRREMHRKLAATRKRSHGHLAHQVRAQGETIALEVLSYRGWQKRYGKSIGRSAPSAFISHLTHLVESTGGRLIGINARRAKLSQTCHCGVIAPKRLSERWHHCSCGASAQRDLYSAFLACFVNSETSLLDAGRAKLAWPARESVLQAAFEQATKNQPASARIRPSSFGAGPPRPSQSGSPATGRTTDAKVRDAVTKRRRAERARKRRRGSG